MSGYREKCVPDRDGQTLAYRTLSTTPGIKEISVKLNLLHFL